MENDFHEALPFLRWLDSNLVGFLSRRKAQPPLHQHGFPEKKRHGRPDEEEADQHLKRKGFIEGEDADQKHH